MYTGPLQHEGLIPPSRNKLQNRVRPALTQDTDGHKIDMKFTVMFLQKCFVTIKGEDYHHQTTTSVMTIKLQREFYLYVRGHSRATQWKNTMDASARENYRNLSRTKVMGSQPQTSSLTKWMFWLLMPHTLARIQSQEKGKQKRERTQMHDPNTWRWS